MRNYTCDSRLHSDCNRVQRISELGTQYWDKHIICYIYAFFILNARSGTNRYKQSVNGHIRKIIFLKLELLSSQELSKVRIQLWILLEIEYRFKSYLNQERFEVLLSIEVSSLRNQQIQQPAQKKPVGKKTSLPTKNVGYRIILQFEKKRLNYIRCDVTL